MRAYGNRNHTIDMTKGVLILLVFIGHLLPSDKNQIFLRYFIYFFHMPAFIAVSGFLYNDKKGLNISYYVRRMVIPWWFAINFYYALRAFFCNDVSIEEYKNYIKYFDYHLWYIPACLLFSGILTVFKTIFGKNKFFYFNSFVIASIISCISAYELIDCLPIKVPMFLQPEVFRHNFHMFFFTYYIWGVCIKKRLVSYPPHILLKNLYAKCFAATIVLVLFSAIGFYYKAGGISNIVKWFVNLYICYVILLCCYIDKCPRVQFLEIIGKNSLPLYLYHVALIRISERFFGGIEYYFCAILFFIGLIMLSHFIREKKIWVFDILFGNI